jgi:hypothetical protein
MGKQSGAAGPSSARAARRLVGRRSASTFPLLLDSQQLPEILPVVSRPRTKQFALSWNVSDGKTLPRARPSDAA